MQTEAKDVEKAFCARISEQNGGEACSIAWLIAMFCACMCMRLNKLNFSTALEPLFHVFDLVHALFALRLERGC